MKEGELRETGRRVGGMKEGEFRETGRRVGGMKDLTRLPPRDSTLDGGWTRKPFGLSRVQPIYLSIPRPS